MTDQLIVANSEAPTALAPTVTNVPANACTSEEYEDGKYTLSDSDTEKPVILELGSAYSNTNRSCDPLPPPYPAAFQVDLQRGNSTYLPQHPEMTSSHLPLYSNHHYINSNISNGISTIHMPTFMSSHIPQTVSSWPGSDLQNSGKISDIGMVPPPVFINYVGAQEHMICKEANPTWKDRAMQIEKGINC